MNRELNLKKIINVIKAKIIIILIVAVVFAVAAFAIGVDIELGPEPVETAFEEAANKIKRANTKNCLKKTVSMPNSTTANFQISKENTQAGVFSLRFVWIKF